MRKPSATKAQAERVPDKGPDRYVARRYHEINAPSGVMRVEPGMVVVTNGNQVGVYPPDLFDAEFPEVDRGDIPEKD